MSEGRICTGTSYLVLLVLLAGRTADGACQIPELYQGVWYSLESGKDTRTTVEGQQWGDMKCEAMKVHPNAFNAKGLNATLLLHEQSSNCWRCVDVLWRTPDILQYRKSQCFTNNRGIELMCPGYRELPEVEHLTTMFNEYARGANCETMLQGFYSFKYESSWGGGGVCDSPESEIMACQEPGSPYTNNEIFYMKFGGCPDLPTLRNHTIKYQCLGSWSAISGGWRSYTYAAVADVKAKDKREMFKCLLIGMGDKFADNAIFWGMSRFGDCSTLNSVFDSPARLKLTQKDRACEPFQDAPDSTRVVEG